MGSDPVGAEGRYSRACAFLEGNDSGDVGARVDKGHIGQQSSRLICRGIRCRESILSRNEEDYRPVLSFVGLGFDTSFFMEVQCGRLPNS